MKILRPLCLALFLALTAWGCTTIRPASVPERPPEPTRPFSHGELDRVLSRYADEQGRVDYAALKEDPGDLERYFLLLSLYSPDSHPELFPTEESRLAYWLNAYNAAAIRIVLTHYPIGSVREVREPLLLFFMPKGSGFFVFQRVTFGGATTNLYHLENGVVRKRFADPRVHFALNCAARGCPRLPREAFDPRRLEEQLDREARRFLAEERNFRIDHGEKAVYLSSIFDWYEDEFLKWCRERFPGREATLLDYVALYLPGEKAEELKRAASYEVRFIPYDWRLNDRKGSP